MQQRPSTFFQPNSATTVVVVITVAVTLFLLLVSGSSAALAATGTVSSLSSDVNDDNDSSCAANHQMTLHPHDEKLVLYHFDTVSSTQDRAKNLILEKVLTTTPHDTTVCVTATQQTAGRGTSGRQWQSTGGNVFVTIGIPMEAWSSRVMVPLTLLPLKVGELTAVLIQQLLKDCSKDHDAAATPIVNVKWPNDVLCDGKKISGTLIESAGTWFLIGVGINLEHAPPIPTSGTNHGRPSTSVREYCPNDTTDGVDTVQRARQVGVDLAYQLHRWLHSESHHDKTADAVLQGWKQFVDWDMELVMRDTPDRERVKLLEVLPDGRVKVRNVEDGSERVLVSDYFL
jgi:biotin-(acetyl-CoA carboxylase) ligase